MSEAELLDDMATWEPGWQADQVVGLSDEEAIDLGGWDQRYGRPLVTAVRGDVAAAIVDSNGDEADTDLDLYILARVVSRS